MGVHTSILRGINVSGKKKIGMTALKALYEALSLEEIQTYIQSGNVVLRSPGIDPGKLHVAFLADTPAPMKPALSARKSTCTAGTDTGGGNFPMSLWSGFWERRRRRETATP